ncbi:hypothetical protein DV515_00015397 [Chloebia gouldiae]|uniref:Uncharacterized protein n=1 Tax=Chloebia gouldiae TaxID=44316 RepID=A0A3L8RVN6_CHLGU|nr:hypothetical protein DV515_00015397 [Chloebia gouldiae]
MSLLKASTPGGKYHTRTAANIIPSVTLDIGTFLPQRPGVCLLTFRSSTPSTGLQVLTDILRTKRYFAFCKEQ